MDAKNVNIDVALLEYLKAKGYKNAEKALKEDANVVEAMPAMAMGPGGVSQEALYNMVAFHNKEETRPTIYDHSYSAFKDWAHSSLDLYKPELMSVLYPIFVHCYLDLVEKGHKTEASSFLRRHRSEHSEKHKQEIDRLETVLTPEHMKENEMVINFREHKFNLQMCSYSFELLLAFLHDKKFMLLLSIINQYLIIKVHTGQPKPRDPDSLYTPISGETDKEIATLHKKEIYWGLFDEQKKYMPQLSDSESEARQPKRIKKDEGDEEPTETKIGLPALDDRTEEEILEDLRKWVKLGPERLPSICLYTFFNTYDTCNQITTSKTGSLVAAGFSDSTIKLWDLEADDSRWNKATKQYWETDGRDTAYIPRHRDTSAFFPLAGHSGPVYGLSFSPDSQFLLSCSQDTTTRLWNMETKTNVVCYRGHSFPVWDVSFSSLGYYFVTGSHDRSARLWCTNHTNPVRVFAGHLSDVNTVRFHPNCNFVVSGSSDKCVRVWDVNSGNCVRVFTGHYSTIYAVAVSPDGRFIASAGEDKDIVLWDLAVSNRLATFKGHKDIVWSLDFSIDSNLLASGSADKTVRLWDIKSLREEIVRKEREDDDEQRLEEMALELENEEEAQEKENDKEKEIKEKEKEKKAQKKNDIGDESIYVPGHPGLLASFPTKKTPVTNVQFTRRNLLLAAGPYKRTDKKDTKT
uniref:TFIID subunit TAF5 NTD2 domain-containing protein n=1 Tax=Arcella intermedia TaxID=1963864 RepID=A0A6B2KZ13_9EUKA|eukprot:TRINITY_DN13373_c0_g1_i1.p1 TRINITY_DN13373_c0_g1~~TRINITY_DN13373_c0_g1_i1.p1  ORF type:complete len:690 (-),score=177.97 TRINITY_DN13373_c0_g1_i1:22-2091(-)